MSKPTPLKHLLIPGVYRVWCRPNERPGPGMGLTIFPSKATCANCLTAMRTAHGNARPFRVAHVNPSREDRA